MNYENQKLLLNSEKKCIQIQIEKANTKSVRGEMKPALVSAMLNLSCFDNSSICIFVHFSQIKLLQKSSETILACRKSLMISYIFAHFMIEDNQKSILEENQHGLENSVEFLSNYLQVDETYANIAQSCITIKNKTE